MKTFLKCFGTVLCSIGLITYASCIALALSNKENQELIPILFLMIMLMVFFIWLIWRKRNKKKPIYYPMPQKTVKLTDYQALEIRRQFEILNDCVSVIGTTVSADVFFSRLNLALETLKKLEGYVQLGTLPNEELSNLRSEFTNGLEEIVDDFIERAYAKEVLSANQLKTDNGRKKRLQRFVDTMLSSFAEASITYTNQLYTQNNQDRLCEMQKELSSTSITDVADKLLKLKKLLDTGIITPDEYEDEKQKLLGG